MAEQPLALAVSPKRPCAGPFIFYAQLSRYTNQLKEGLGTMKLAPKQLFFTIVLVLSGAIVTLVINSTSPIAAVSNSAFIQMSNLLLLMVDATSKPLGTSQSRVMTKPSTIWGGCMKRAPPYPRVGRRS